MTFTLESLFLILSTTIVFYVLRGRARAYVLLASSCYFIWQLSSQAFITLAAATLLSYAAGLALGKLQKKSTDDTTGKAAKKQELAFFTAVTLIAVAVLVFYKYVPHILTLNGHVVPKGATPANLPGKIAQIMIPVGLSYYMFQVIAYFADIKSGRIRAEKNFAHFALFMSFFPKFVSGPIERPDEMLPQIKKLGQVRLFADLRLERALTYITVGYAMKLIIADRLAPFAYVMTASEHYSVLILWFEIFMYSIQLYADFAGYSCIAIGVAHLLGMDLVQNFHAPYLSAGFTEFWRRWHMSLSRFLRDYVYISLGGNRKGFIRKCLNLMIVFVICGLWHGSGIRYLAWGALHGAIIVAENLFSRGKKKSETGLSVPAHVFRFFRRILTFVLVSIMWIFFGAPSFSVAISYMTKAFTQWGGDIVPLFLSHLESMTTRADLIVVFISVIVLLVCDVFAYGMKKPFAEILCGVPTLVRGIVLVILILMIMVFGMYGPAIDPAQFMYMAF